jgi:two-component system, LuxR family, sensor kinase FixL
MAAHRLLLGLIALLVAAQVVLAISGATGDLTLLVVRLSTAALLLLAMLQIYLEARRTDRRAASQTSANTRMASSTREAEARFQAILDNAHDAIIAIDAQGRIETFNKAAERIFGYRAEEVIARNVSLLMPEPHRGAHDGYLHNYLRTGQAKIIGIGREVEGVRKDGTLFPLDLAVTEMRTGDRLGFIGILRDLSLRRDAERQVRALTNELAHVSRLGELGQFTSAIAHELNQPLTAIMNYAEAARAIIETNPARAIEHVGKAAAQAERAGQIIRRVRDMVEKKDSERTTEQLSRVVEEASGLATLGAKLDGIRVDYRLAPDLPPIAIDKVQVQQVVVNLVRNAVEALHGQPRRELTIATAAAEDGNQMVTIADTGPGIPPDIQPRLFTPFVSGKPGGMGIGLSISQSIIEAHGGRIWAEPNPDGGTLFRFILPPATGIDDAP